MLKLRALVSVLSAAGLLSACGGWWEDEPRITMTGVVAQGAALAGATLSVKCATGTGTAMSALDGSYTLNIPNGSLPCVVEARSADGSLALHSALPASSSSTVTVNVTPLTTLLVAQMVGADPATFFADSATVAALAKTITPDAVAAAQAVVIDILKTSGIDTSALSDLVSQPLVATSGLTTGNGYDKALDAVTQALSSSGLTLNALATTLATTATTNASATSTAASDATTASAGTGSAATLPPLPTGLLLAPKAATCDSLRSGTYRFVGFAPRPADASDAIANTGTLTIDAVALKATWKAGATAETWTAHASDKCRFTTAGKADVVVSPAGVLAMRTLGTEAGVASARALIAFPEQALTAADLAGKWNSTSWSSPATGTRTWNLSGGMSTFELDASGAMTSVACAADTLATTAANCQVKTSLLPKLVANSAGGFTLTPTNPADTSLGRVFAYRAGNGTLMMVQVDGATGDFGLATKVRTLTTPSVGQTATNWNININANQLGTDVVTGNTWTAKSVDSAAGSYVRTAVTAGADSGTAQDQTIVVNHSRDGYSKRVAATGTSPNGSAYTVREFYSMGFAGMGFSAVILPRTNAAPANSNAVFILSVAAPAGTSITGPMTAASLLSNFVSGTRWDKAALAYMPLNPTGLVGAWSLSPTGDAGAQTFFFFPNGEYVMVDPVGDTAPSACGGPGIERGTYSAGLSTVSASVDTNGCAGLNDTVTPANSGLKSLSFAADGMSATATGRDGSVTPIYRQLR